MDMFLAEYFGNTPKTASTQQDVSEQEKAAAAQDQVELFSKLAAVNGIDLEQLNEQQIAYLWDATFSKTASEEEKKDEKEKDSEGEPPPFAKKDDGDADDKKEEAKKEHEEKKEAMAKMAEADFLGRVMAHSMVAELRKIAEVAETAPEGEQEKDAGAVDKAKSLAHGAGEFLKRQGKNAVEDAKNTVKAHKMHKAFGETEKLTRQAGSGADLTRMEKATDAAKAWRNRSAGRTALRAGGAAAAAGGGVAAAKAGKGDKEKKGSAFEELAGEKAIEKAAEAGWNVEQAVERVSSVMTLELLGESEKVASIQDTDVAIEVRALEYLEAAGYPVTWEQG